MVTKAISKDICKSDLWAYTKAYLSVNRNARPKDIFRFVNTTTMNNNMNKNYYDQLYKFVYNGMIIRTRYGRYCLPGATKEKTPKRETPERKNALAEYTARHEELAEQCQRETETVEDHAVMDQPSHRLALSIGDYSLTITLNLVRQPE